MKQSASGYIRQHLAEIEKNIEFGIKHESIVEQINKDGITIDLATFRTSLYRARKSKANKLASFTPPLQNEAYTQPKPKEQIRPEEKTPPKPTKEEIVSNPRELDKILNATVDLGALAKIGKKI